MELIIINFMSLFSLLCLFSASAVAAPAPAAANNSTCPMDFNYALKIPWNYTPCGKTSPINEIKTWCCPNLLSLYRVALSRHLKDTSKFLLPNHPTSVSCVQDFQNKLVYFPLLDDAVSICLDPLKFVISPNTCAGIQSTQDWVSQLGPTTLLNSACRPYLANSDCIKCVSAIEKVQAELYSRDGNTSHATDCRLFTIMYAAGIVNQFGPESDRVGNCLSSANFQVDSPKSKKHTVAVVGAILSTALFILVAASSFYYWRRMKDNNGQGFKWFFKSDDRENLERNQSVCLYDTERQIAEFIKSDQFREDEKNDIDVPFVVLESIRVATNNFSDSNKLGKGGFGSVYKGKFPGGQEIAVKRLSSCSGQGFQEFKNEVLLIAKLQHRNLVRLLGYCVEGEEKMLLYEYMPNKSLDYFIFDRTRRVLLNWEISFDIILGIARGLLYLHHDSRLRIIHRDLKTSNVLLDKEMNPKISDFGLARIVEGKRTEASTTRVVGTYGYMPPEYALHGYFSIKSDVFSFGVMVLEIISGKRNTGFYQPETEMSLLGYAWKLWKENKPLDLMDATLSKTCNANEFLRCLNIGLLCVQEDPSERPTMSTVVFLLESETVNLPIPKPPAFVAWRFLSSSGSSSQPLSVNELSNTLQQGR